MQVHISEIVEICDGMTRMDIKKRENYWIEYYRNLKGWNVINRRDTVFKKPLKSLKPKTKIVKIEVLEDDYEEIIDRINQVNYDGKIRSIK